MNPVGEQVQIRRMTPADLDRVMEIAQSLPHAPQWPEAAYRTALDPQSLPRRSSLVAHGPLSGIVGFAIASQIGPQAELETIAVAVGSQRQGVARQLLGGLATGLRSAQVTEVILEVRASNHPALALYRSAGFVETGRRPRYYADPQEDAVLMSLQIR